MTLSVHKGEQIIRDTKSKVFHAKLPNNVFRLGAKIWALWLIMHLVQKGTADILSICMCRHVN
jgi:hypothetical protein